jgi:type IV pilus assembly protein PilO
MVKGLSGAVARLGRQPRLVARVALVALLLADLIVAAVVLKPWAGTAEDLERQAVALRQQLREQQAAVERLRNLAEKISAARTAGDGFLRDNFLDRRTASSAILSEALNMAQKAGVKQKETTFQVEPVEGSETLSMMTVTANYEGTFADLMQFLHLLDGASRFLILDSLQAAPQQAGLLLNISMKLHCFVREAPGAGS